MGNNNRLEKLKIIDRDMIKYIVLIFMGTGHLMGWIFIPDTKAIYHMPVFYQILTNMSLIAPPTFFFFISEGFRYTRSRKNYAKRLFIFACITQVFYYMLWLRKPVGILDLVYGVNVFFSLFCNLIVLMIYESDRPKKKKILLIILVTLASLLTEWGVFCVGFTLIWYVWRDNIKKRSIMFTLLTVFYSSLSLTFTLIGEKTWSTKYELLGTGVRFAAMMMSYVLITFFYNGKKGKYPVFSKWFFYIFYPAHVFVAAILNRFIV